jgi:NAD-dependent SIR2 family protein deacetylase
MKTNKHQTLLLVKGKGGVQARDVVHAFKYTPGTARSYLAHLGRQGLLQRTEAGHTLTTKGADRLQFFEVAGCADAACPRCQGKAGLYTCSTCGAQLPKKDARLKPTWDTVFFKREAGVYCPVCQGQMFTEEQARLAEIQMEVS